MMELSFNPLLIGVPLPTCRLPELRVKLPRMFQSPSHRGTASNPSLKNPFVSNYLR